MLERISIELGIRNRSIEPLNYFIKALLMPFLSCWIPADSFVVQRSHVSSLAGAPFSAVLLYHAKHVVLHSSLHRRWPAILQF